MTKIKLKNKGVTLIEMLIAIAIAGIIMAGSAGLFKAIFSTGTQKPMALTTIDQARKTVFNFTNELRNSNTGSTGAYPINLANDSEIIFFSSYGASSGLINRIRYYVSNGALYKGTVVPTGNPLTYNAGSETSKLVQSALATTTPTIFYYYDGSYGGTTTPLTQPVNVNKIKYVKISLNLLKKDEKNATTTFSISAGTTLRNLKTNLGD